MSGAMRKSAPFRVLLDMDCVLADFEGNYLKCFREKFPNEPFVPLADRRHFYISDDYKKFEEQSPDILSKARSVYETPGFFGSQPPIEGALAAAKEISGLTNVEVFLCTSPLTKTPGVHHDIMEKLEWTEKHLGMDWVKRVIITKDKTMVHGNILIDDRPKIKGVLKPLPFKHILFTASHNRHLDLRATTAAERLDNWTDGSWQTLVEKYMKLM
ncbi:hypothetical protein CAPTEDRAFT_176034 [Capitella teleta]|uniref:Uncharacterized protein n=1 Tax=Capitella teleta TaxID=283909 RepID=R7UGX4_CAPTE|nr:hypothetical protein CAPTEDRAFT_176034 [Capitella teleta]|eukprot:ELU05460.1 hypothetical protein CAPTEDRAFT_176034 [Capitella teleta]